VLGVVLDGLYHACHAPMHALDHLYREKEDITKLRGVRHLLFTLERHA
jgi:hypothetical protein